jgi:hypothetical protein
MDSANRERKLTGRTCLQLLPCVALSFTLCTARCARP